MKKIFYPIIVSLLFLLNMSGEIIKTAAILDVKSQVEENTLIFFNIAEVLMDTECSLGSQAWRKYIRSRLDAKTHDEMTLFVFEKVPPIAPEITTAELVRELQANNPVFAFTSRGRHEWYSSQVDNIDLITEAQLNVIGFDFSKSRLEDALEQLPTLFPEHFHNGIIYATNSLDKDELLESILTQTGYQPSKIVFVDDKIDSLTLLENRLNEMNIPFVGFQYSKTSQNHAKFDPMIASIQLDWLISFDQLLSDDEAAQIKLNSFSSIDPEIYFQSLVEKWKTQRL